ncbi:DUF456 domain-containing protein [Streptomyces sp. NBC_00271]|uniref:DUF456 domain-containing protein n=1 Tax=Streptomyces sp. NBC_00271 TaxID=2975697 RepID=UPI003FA6DCFF
MPDFQSDRRSSYSDDGDDDRRSDFVQEPAGPDEMDHDAPRSRFSWDSNHNDAQRTRNSSPDSEESRRNSQTDSQDELQQYRAEPPGRVRNGYLEPTAFGQEPLSRYGVQQEPLSRYGVQREPLSSGASQEKPQRSPKASGAGGLLKFLGRKRWVSVVAGALVGFAVGGPLGAVLGAGVGLLAGEVARQVLHSREKKQQAQSSADAVVSRMPERSQSWTPGATSQRWERSNAPTVNVGNRSSSVEQRETRDFDRGSMTVAASARLKGPAPRGVTPVAPTTSQRSYSPPQSPGRRASR